MYPCTEWGGDEGAAAEGDVLMLEADRNILKKRLKVYSFPRAGLSDAAAKPHADEPKEGDVLDLDPAVVVGETRKGGKLVGFGKTQGRPEEFYRAKRPAWEEMYDDLTGGAREGDVLQVEVRKEVTEKRATAPTFSKVERWESHGGDQGGNGE